MQTEVELARVERMPIVLKEFMPSHEECPLATGNGMSSAVTIGVRCFSNAWNEENWTPASVAAEITAAERSLKQAQERDARSGGGGGGSGGRDSRDGDRRDGDRDRRDSDRRGSGSDYRSVQKFSAPIFRDGIPKVRAVTIMALPRGGYAPKVKVNSVSKSI